MVNLICQCRQVLNVPDSKIGRSVSCERCGRLCNVPIPEGMDLNVLERFHEAADSEEAERRDQWRRRRMFRTLIAEVFFQRRLNLFTMLVGTTLFATIMLFMIRLSAVPTEPRRQYEIAEQYITLDDRERGIEAYRFLMRKYPHTTWARKAGERLAELDRAQSVPPASGVSVTNEQPPNPADPAVKIAAIFTQTLPKADFRKVSVVTVEYAPGAKSPKHRHDVAVFAYVLQGAVESQLEGEEPKLFKEGEVWYEPPGTVHLGSRNASKTDRAKFLVFFVQEEGKAPTTLVK